MKKDGRLGLVAVFLFQLGACAQTTSWKGVSTDWSNPANWTAGVPTANLDAIIGDVNFTGTRQPDLSASSVCKSLTIGTGSKASTLKVDKPLTVFGSVTIGPNGTINHTASTILGVRSNWNNGGKYTASNNGATVGFSGAAQLLAGVTTFKRLTINAGSTTTLNANVVVGNLLTVSGTLDPGESPSFKITGAAKSVVNSGGRIVVKTPTFNGNYATTGSITLNAGSTVDYAAVSVNQTVDPRFTYGTLRISGGLTKTLGGNLLPLNSTLAASGNVIVAGGTLDLSSFTANRGTTVAGGTIAVADGATLRIGGTNPFPVNYQTHSLAETSTIEYSGTSQTVSLEAYGNLTLSSSAGAAIKTLPTSPLTLAGSLRGSAGVGTSVSFTARAPITVSGSVVLGPSAFFDGASFAHSVGGSWANDGAFNSIGSITLSGTGATMSGSGSNNFNNLTFSGADITAATGTSLNLAGNLVTVGAGSFAHLAGGAGTVRMSGTDKTVTGSGISLNHLAIPGAITTPSSLTVRGNLSVAGGFSATAGTITLSGVANTISGAGAIAFNALDVPGRITTGSDFSIKSSLSVSGSLVAAGGIATFAGSSTLSGAADLFHVNLNGTKLQLGAASVLGVSGSFTITAGTFDAATTVPNTVNYNATGAQTVTSSVYNNLTISGTGTKAAGGDLTVNGDLTIAPGATFNLSPHSLALSGNWNNQGSFLAGTSTVQLFGSLDSSVTGATIFNSLALNKSTPGSVVALNNPVTVATLNMASGRMLTGPNSVTITSDRTGSGIILGTITRTHPFLPTTAYAFESPDSTITFASLAGISSITVAVMRSPLPDFPLGGSVNRQYQISMVAAGPYQATLRLHYEDSELAGSNESMMQLWRFGSPWAAVGKSANDSVANWVEKESLTELTGRWTFSEAASAVRWIGSVSTAWETTGNWMAVQGNPSLPPSTNDLVDLGTAPFVRHPTISSPVSVRGLSFGDVEELTLTLGGGGSLTTAGNITGTWTNAAPHAIQVGDQTLNVGGALLLSDGTNGHTIHLKIGSGSVTVAGKLVESGDANLTFTGPGKLNLGDDFIYTGGTFTPGSSTVTYQGSGAQLVAGAINYNNLSFDKPSGTATMTNSATVGGSLVLTNSGTFLVKAALAISNDLTIYTNAALDADSSTLSIAGDWNRFGTFAAGSSTVQFNGSGSQSITPTGFHHLTINKAAGTATLAGNLSIDGDLNLAAGNLDLGGFTANRSALGGTLTLADSTLLKVGNSFPANFSARNAAADSVVEYNGTGPQSVMDGSYGNLHFSNGSAQAKTLTGPLAIRGDLFIKNGATLNSGGFVLEVDGDWINDGVFVPAGGSVTLSGSAKNLSGMTTFNDLTIRGNYTTFSDVTVDGTMELSGIYQAGDTRLTLAGDLVNTGTLSSAGTITFTGTGPQAIALNAGFNSTGMVNFNGSVAPHFTGISSPTLQNVTINNTAGVAPFVGWVVNGQFVVSSGATFAGGAGIHTFKSNFANNGFVSSSGTLVFDPSAPVTLELGASSSVSAGVVVLGGTGLITLAGGTPTWGTVVVANTHSAGLTPSANWVLARDLIIGSGSTLQGNGLTFTVAGDWSNNGAFNGQTSTVILTGSGDPAGGGQIAGIGASTFNHLVIAGLVTANGDFAVTGNFTNNGAFDGTGAAVTFLGSNPSAIAGTTTPTLFDALTIAKASAQVALGLNLVGLTDLTVTSGTLDSSSFTISEDAAGGALTVADGAKLRIGGSSSLPLFTSYNFEPASTVEYYGSGTQTIAAANYGNLTSSSNGARILSSSSTIGIAGTFVPGSNPYTIAGSTVDYNGTGTQTITAFNYFSLGSSSGGARILSPTGTIGIARTFTPGGGPYTTTNSTISFNGANQTIPAFPYYHLVISGSGTKTLGADITVSSSLALTAGTLADAGFIATVNGDLANSATHTGAGKILLSGGVAEHLLSGSGLYNNLELDDPLGARLSITNLTINGTLTFTAGNITTTTNKVIINPAGNVAHADGHVVGNLQKNVAAAVAVTNTFEIGDAAHYAPVTVILTNVTAAGRLTARVTGGDHPDLANAGISATRGVSRYWTMTNSGALFGSYRALFNFGGADNAANPANFIVAKLDGSAWTLPTVGNRTLTNLLAVGMTNFSEFAVGEPIPPSPTISAQPQSQVVNAGADAVFSVDATGTGTLTYQWYFNGDPIAGATNSTLVITNVDGGDSGTYSVIVDNGALTTSSLAVLTINLPPAITPISDQPIDEEKTLTVIVSASDPEGSAVTYGLTQAPSGATISPTGTITWMPTEDQGPNNYTFTVRSTDTQSASATRTFTVIVNEVNRAPVLAAIADRTAAIGSKVSFTAMATDPDIPANALNFSLAGAPPGATIDPNSGVFDWTIPGPNSSTNVVTVVVTDNGSPAISATRTFKIIGTVGAGPYIQGIELTNGQALISFAGIPGETHWVQATTNLNNSAAWITVATNVPAQNGLFQYVDNQVKTFPSRFFRAIIPL